MVFCRHRQQAKWSPLHRWQTATPQATCLETDGVVIDEETAATIVDSFARVPKRGRTYTGRYRQTAMRLATAALRVAVVAIARNRSQLHGTICRHFGSGTAATNPEQTQQRQHKQCDVGTMFHADKFTFFFVRTQKNLNFLQKLLIILHAVALSNSLATCDSHLATKMESEIAFKSVYNSLKITRLRIFNRFFAKKICRSRNKTLTLYRRLCGYRHRHNLKSL